MQLSDLTMKKQILFGQIWKRLKIIVVDLNHYELILALIPNKESVKTYTTYIMHMTENVNSLLSAVPMYFFGINKITFL